MPKFPALRERLGDKFVDLWLPVSFLITYVMWIVTWYQDGEFKTLGDAITGAVIAVIASAFSFWMIAIALLILAIPVVILCKTLARLFSR